MFTIHFGGTPISGNTHIGKIVVQLKMEHVCSFPLRIIGVEVTKLKSNKNSQTMVSQIHKQNEWLRKQRNKQKDTVTWW